MKGKYKKKYYDGSTMIYGNDMMQKKLPYYNKNAKMVDYDKTKDIIYAQDKKNAVKDMAWNKGLDMAGNIVGMATPSKGGGKSGGMDMMSMLSKNKMPKGGKSGMMVDNIGTLGTEGTPNNYLNQEMFMTKKGVYKTKLKKAKEGILSSMINQRGAAKNANYEGLNDYSGETTFDESKYQRSREVATRQKSANAGGTVGQAVGTAFFGPVGGAVGKEVGALTGTATAYAGQQLMKNKTYRKFANKLGIKSEDQKAKELGDKIKEEKGIAQTRASYQRFAATSLGDFNDTNTSNMRSFKKGFNNITPKDINTNYKKYRDIKTTQYSKGGVSLSIGKGEKDPKGGLTQKGVDKYNRSTGGNMKMAVTTKPSELKEGSKDANRRKSFCARMGGMEGAMKKPNGEPTRKNLALKKWNCKEGCGNVKKYKYKEGSNMLKRADGSYSKIGLWDNIRANKGSGNKPTKEMLKQESKIKKFDNGLNKLKLDDFSNKNTGSFGGRLIDDKTKGENKINVAYRERLQNDSNFRDQEVKSGNAVIDGRIFNYKPKGNSSKNKLEYGGYFKKENIGLEPKEFEIPTPPLNPPERKISRVEIEKIPPIIPPIKPPRKIVSFQKYPERKVNRVSFGTKGNSPFNKGVGGTGNRNVMERMKRKKPGYKMGTNKLSSKDREILTEDREAHFLKKKGKYVLINDVNKPITHTNNNYEGRSAIIVPKSRYGLKNIVNHNSNVSNNPKDSLILPEGTSIVTANEGKNKLALQKYKMGDQKGLSKIINSMPKDKLDKKEDGSDGVYADDYSEDATGGDGGRLIDDKTKGENKINIAYRKRVQTDVAFRKREIEKGKVRINGKRLEYKPVGSDSKNSWEFGGYKKDALTKLDPKPSTFADVPIEPNKTLIPTTNKSNINTKNIPTTNKYQKTGDILQKGQSLVDGIRLSDINNIRMGLKAPKSIKLVDPDNLLENYQDTSNATRKAYNSAKEVSANNARNTTANSQEYLANSRVASQMNADAQSDINEKEVGKMYDINNRNIERKNKYSDQISDNRNQEKITNLDLKIKNEEQFEKGLEGMDEANYRSKKDRRQYEVDMENNRITNEGVEMNRQSIADTRESNRRIAENDLKRINLSDQSNKIEEQKLELERMRLLRKNSKEKFGVKKLKYKMK